MNHTILHNASNDGAFLLDLLLILYNGSSSAIPILNLSEILQENEREVSPIVCFANAFYAYVTPVIIFCGLVGNAISLRVLVCPPLRHLSANRYLSALCIADIATLIFYVLTEWLRRGLSYFTTPDAPIPVLEVQGLCQIWLFLSYASRFVSAWLIVCFTAERFAAVYRPLKKRGYGFVNLTMRTIYILIIIACVISAYKPFVSEVRTIRQKTICASIKELSNTVFVLDAIFGFSITVVPFLIIMTFNILIIYQLFLKNKERKTISISPKFSIKAEVTTIVLAVSLCFVTFSLPFLVSWLLHYFHHNPIHESESLYNIYNANKDTWDAILRISRTVYYMNFSVNFFLYSVTGSSFRRHLVELFTGRKKKVSNQSTFLLLSSPVVKRAAHSGSRQSAANSGTGHSETHTGTGHSAAHSAC